MICADTGPDDEFCDRKRSAALCRLRRGAAESLPSDPLHGPRHGQRKGFEIDVLPAQTHNFTPAEASG